MRTALPLTLLALAVPMLAQQTAPITTNPIPEKIIKRGLAVEIKELARLPDTRTLRPADQDINAGNYARVSYVRDLPDGIAGARHAADTLRRLHLV